MAEVLEEALRRATEPIRNDIDELIDRLPKSLEDVLIEIRDHFYDPGYTAQDLQEAVGKSNWLYTRFRQLVGLTPWKFIQECRMELALRLLRDTSLYVKDVSTYVGYEDFASFMRLSLKWCRLTPAQLRAQLRERKGALRALPENVFSYGYYQRAVSGQLSPEEARQLILYLESTRR